MWVIGNLGWVDSDWEIKYRLSSSPGCVCDNDKNKIKYKIYWDADNNNNNNNNK